jgi:hypothetical protein
MTELGVYILGATALAILAAAGIAMQDNTIIFAAVIASGFAYLSQLGANHTATTGKMGWSVWLNAVAMLVALAAWAYGALQIL